MTSDAPIARSAPWAAHMALSDVRRKAQYMQLNNLGRAEYSRLLDWELGYATGKLWGLKVFTDTDPLLLMAVENEIWFHARRQLEGYGR